VRAREVALLGAVLIGAAMGWVLLLRRQVRSQTAEIRERFEREAALERRYRELVENATDVVLTHDLTDASPALIQQRRSCSAGATPKSLANPSRN
jgi:PAS domain-containing protein